MRVTGSLPRSALAPEARTGGGAARTGRSAAAACALCAVRSLLATSGCSALIPLWPGRPVSSHFMTVLGAVGRTQAWEAAAPARLALLAAAGPD